MKGKLTLQQRLILPIVLLGLITLLSNLLAVFSINNVHANAGRIIDQGMTSVEQLEDIRRSVMEVHRLALSHIVAADHATMIQLVQEIKAEEGALDEKLGAFEAFVSPEGQTAFQELCSSYDELKHWSVWSAPARTARPRMPMPPPTGTWPAGAGRRRRPLTPSPARSGRRWRPPEGGSPWFTSSR